MHSEPEPIATAPVAVEGVSFQIEGPDWSSITPEGAARLLAADLKPFAAHHGVVIDATTSPGMVIAFCEGLGCDVQETLVLALEKTNGN